MDNTDKQAKLKTLEANINNIKKNYGKGAIMSLGDQPTEAIPVISTGSIGLDTALGVGGLPKGRVIEIFGPESSGKTTVALHIIAEAQKDGGIAAFIDAEHALDPHYAKKLGVDIDNLLLSQPDHWEQALQIAEELAKTWSVKMIVIDSVAALVPRAEVEWDMGDSYMWLQARMMSQWLRKLTGVLAKTGTICIFINQIRMKIGIMFGNPETTSGWNALKFFATQRIEIRKWDKLEENKEQIWYFAKIKTAKNKIFAPFKTAEIPVKRWVGYDHIFDIIEAGIILKLITRSWAFYSLGDKKVQWKEKLVELLNEDKKILENLEKDIQKNIKDMRTWKKVLDDDVLDDITEIVENLE